tara:strand:+ start:958 stop:1269 length:312 start_codon:yes stop_codon:yes gene_type:complete
MNSNIPNWDEVSGRDLVGLSEFQRLCCTALLRSNPDLDFEESGSKERYYLADVAKIDATIYVYQTGAEIVSSTIDDRFEACDYDNPDKLIRDLISKLVTLGAT